MTRRRPAPWDEARARYVGPRAGLGVSRCGHNLILFLLFSVPENARGRHCRPSYRETVPLLTEGIERRFWKRLACERSAFARVSNQSATSLKPAVTRGLGHTGVHVRCTRGSRPRSPLFRLAAVRPIGSPVAGSPHCSRYSEMTVRRAWSRPQRWNGIQRIRRQSPRRQPWRRSRDKRRLAWDSPAKAALRVVFCFAALQLHGFLLMCNLMKNRCKQIDCVRFRTILNPPPSPVTHFVPP